MIEKKEGHLVRLSNFEGPLDLLLYLIKREEVDIYDIPIAEITKQYLEMIEMMRELDLEVAGEFILMAATLIQIKVRMLLPEPEDGAEDEEEDPRAELVRRLVEYKCFKEVSESMESLETHQRRLFSRAYFNWEKQYKKTEVVLREVSLFDLMHAFKVAMENIPSVTAHEVGAIGPAEFDVAVEGRGLSEVGTEGELCFGDCGANHDDGDDQETADTAGKTNSHARPFD